MRLGLTSAFGQVFAFKGSSVGVRGPVSIQTARSITPIMINDMQITKSVNLKDAAGKGPETMGMKYSIDYAIYQFNGSINVQLAEKTGFTEDDANAIHEALKTLFYNDESSARPAGSMEVLRVYWWEHKNKLGDESPAKIFRAVDLKPLEDVDVVKSPQDIDWNSADSSAKEVQCENVDIFED